MRLGRFRGALPLVLMSVLIVVVGSYATVRQDAFLTSFNLNNLLLLAMPLALVSLGQTCALLVGGFDVSVAALMTFCVVVASYTMTFDTSGWALLPGALALIAVGVATGIFNAVLICVLKLPSIIATLGTLSILTGASLLLRDHPEGPISSDAVSGLTKSVSFVPIAFIAVVVLAVAGDVWLYRTRTGLATRAVGLDETSSRRLGMATGRIVFLAFVACSLMASLAGLYLAARVQIGSPILDLGFSLESIACAVLGGAALSGGRGSFVGALLAALFLSLIDNVLPLFHQPTEYSQMTIGVLILLALVLYSAPELSPASGPAGPVSVGSRPATEKRRAEAQLVRDRARMRRRRRPGIRLAANDDPDGVDGLVAGGPEPVRRRRVEGDRPTWAELVDLEPDLHSERAARHVPVLSAAVRHQSVLGTRGGSDRIHDVQELHVGVAIVREPLPADTGREVDHGSCLRPFGEAVSRLDHALLALFAEDVAHGHVELRDDGVERADRRIDPVELDLRDEARRDADSARELAEADAAALSLGAEAVADFRAFERPVRRGRLAS